jgi:hypothetical protein
MSAMLSEKTGFGTSCKWTFRCLCAACEVSLRLLRDRGTGITQAKACATKA